MYPEITAGRGGLVTIGRRGRRHLKWIVRSLRFTRRFRTYEGTYRRCGFNFISVAYNNDWFRRARVTSRRVSGSYDRKLGRKTSNGNGHFFAADYALAVRDRSSFTRRLIKSVVGLFFSNRKKSRWDSSDDGRIILRELPSQVAKITSRRYLKGGRGSKPGTFAI